jgi:FAD/FMN-containing dehydrogenase
VTEGVGAESGQEGAEIWQKITLAVSVAAVTPFFAELPPFGGLISAEHGIGTLKKPFLALCRSAAEIDAMRAVKRALDPNGIMNPGKIFD